MTQSPWPPSRAYDPEGHHVGIVHIGAGAFHRAHQAVYTDDVLATSGGNWRILGVSLRSAELANNLNAQAGRYHLVIRSDQHEPAEMRVIGAMAGVLTAQDGIDPILVALSDPSTRIVSLTITEKAYGYDREKAALDPSNAQIAADLASPDTPGSAIGLIARALQLRMNRGHQAFTVLSCDNLPDNGQLLRAAVLEFAQNIDQNLACWIVKNASFPSTMVDRITPACTPALVEETRIATGRADLAPIETEAFSQWMIEDDFCNGRPDWHKVGALLVDDVTPYENMKLRMLNGAHSLLAYSGFLSGHTYVREVMNDSALAALVDQHIAAAAETLGPLDGINLDDYRQALLRRFANPNIAHETYQIAMDGSQKMPQRIFDPAMLMLERGHDASTFAFATAAWIRYLTGFDDFGETYALRDPRADEFAAICKAHGSDPGAFVNTIFALPNLMPAELATHLDFRDAVQAHLQRMLYDGMPAAIAKITGDRFD